VATPQSLETAHPNWQDLLKWAIDDLRSKTPAIERHRRYYKGDHPRVWLTTKLRTMFRDMVDQMSENWCKLVIDAALMRIRITGWAGDKETQADAFSKLWEENNLEVDQIDLWRRVRRDGEAYTISWHEDGGDESITIVDPTTVAWPCDQTSRSDAEYVVRLWMDRMEGRWRGTLYFEDDVIRVVGPKRSAGDATHPEALAFSIDPDDPGGPHGFPSCPVIRWSMEDRPCSVLESVEPIQDKINKLEANKMVAAEFGAFQQRIYLTEQNIEDGDVDQRPDQAIVIHPGAADGRPTQVIQTTATELRNYDDSIKSEIDKLFSVAMIPRHLNAGQGGRPASGDAAEADEGPFTEMITQFQEVMGACAGELAELYNLEVAPIWRNPVPRPDGQKAVTVTAFKTAGVPLEIVLKKYADWTDEEIEELQNDPAYQQGQLAATLGSLGNAAALGAVDPADAAAASRTALEKAGHRAAGPTNPPPNTRPGGYGA
jgi:hypothetical protein